MDDLEEKSLENEEQANCSEELEKLKAELEEVTDRSLRALAEVENTRRRAQKEKEDAIRYCVSNFAKDVLRIYDNLKLAVNCEADAGAILEGVKMTMSELLNVLKSHGITIVEAADKQFNPNYHQAMAEVESDKETGVIVDVIQDGFMIHDRILRPALVNVSKNTEKEV